MSQAALESVLRRDRVVVGAALAALVIVAWLYLVYLAAAMSHMAPDMASMPGVATAMRPWSGLDVVALTAMWIIMMVAMMTPAAAPMILVFATIYRRRAAQSRPAIPIAVFLLGYLAVWTAFSVVAALAQAALHAAAMLSPMMAAESPLLVGGLLVVAGLFQLTPLKRACLATCRSPISFVMTRWREGRWGAFAMGVRHGLYCLGCCWALMLLLFAAGVMNLLWVAVIAVGVLIEKVVPRGDLVGRVAGVVLFVVGVWLIARSL